MRALRDRDEANRRAEASGQPNKRGGRAGGGVNGRGPTSAATSARLYKTYTSSYQQSLPSNFGHWTVGDPTTGTERPMMRGPGPDGGVTAALRSGTRGPA